MRIALRAHEQTSAKSILPQRMVNRHRWLAGDALVIRVGNDADDAPRRFARAVRQQMSIQRFGVGEETLSDGLADNGDRFRVPAVRVREFAAGDERDAQDREEARRDESVPRPGQLFGVGGRVAFGPEAEVETWGGV